MSALIIHDEAELLMVIVSHSVNCPLNGGFWVFGEEASSGCDDKGNPICTCVSCATLSFKDGSVI